MVDTELIRDLLTISESQELDDVNESSESSLDEAVEDSTEQSGLQEETKGTLSEGVDVTEDGAGTGTGSGTSPIDGTDTPYTVVVAADAEFNAQVLELLQEQAELQEQLQETQEQLLVSNQRLELQNEASISILLIFMIVGLLNYIYKFFKMFF